MGRYRALLGLANIDRTGLTETEVPTNALMGARFMWPVALHEDPSISIRRTYFKNMFI
jgi:hypothetical protein